jgi:hypothetical protein
VHLKDLLDIPGVVGATRYRLHTTVSGDSSRLGESYLAIYDIEGDVNLVLKEIAAGRTEGRMVVTDALDPSNALMVAYEAI